MIVCHCAFGFLSGSKCQKEPSMNCSTRKNLVWTIWALAAVAVLSIATVTGIHAQEKTPKAEAEPSKLASDLIGTWTLVGTPDSEQETPTKRLKFFTGKHWLVTEADDNGKVTLHHGGTYTLDADEYVETIEYAMEESISAVGMKFKFKIKVEGDKYTQIGIENPYSEVWRRAK
jgi:heme/copper-type cytochrome/quinol oxidase subunit 2